MKRVCIFDKEKLEEYAQWEIASDDIRKHTSTDIFLKRLKDNPCPLPKPVEVPSDKELDYDYEASYAYAKKRKINRYWL